MVDDVIGVVGKALREVVERTDGSVAGLLMGFDGLPVELYVRKGESFDVETVGAEYSIILTQVRKAAEMLNVGAAREVSIRAERLTTVIQLLSDEYFVAVALRPEGNLGKARFLLRVNASELRSALG